MRRLAALAAAALALAGCSGDPEANPTGTGGDPATASPPATGAAPEPFTVQEVAAYDQPWAMTFLPGTPYAAITERGGRMLLRDMERGVDIEVDGLPEVHVAGQGGLGDVIPAPSYAQDQRIYLSWVEAGDGGSGAVVGLGRLQVDGGSARLADVRVIWRQDPKVDGDGHFSHRMAISPDKRYLFLSSGERQQMDPAQDLGVNLGKILRLNLDGTAAEGNPFADRGSPTDQIWSYGHRNPLGLAFDDDGNLWSSEMGPRGGDEINLILAGRNYGWPKASNGSHYSGDEIPDHTAGDGFEAPKVWWTPSISPGSLMIYSGSLFPDWRGDAFVGALSGQALIRVDLDGTFARKADQWSAGALGERLREVEQGPDGSIYVLQDGDAGKLLRLVPPS